MDLKVYCIFISLFYYIEPSVITDILISKYIHYVSMFTCGNEIQEILDQKLLSKYGIKSAIVKDKFKNNGHFKMAIVLNSSCENWMVFLEATHLHNRNWLILSEDLPKTINTLSEYPFEVNSDVLVILKKAQDNYQLYEFYNSGYYTNGRVNVINIGYWNNKQFHIRSVKRMDMSGVVLRCMVVVTQPIVNETFEEYVDRSRLDSEDSLHKMKYFTVLKYMKDIYNFSYKLKRINSWGYYHNGTFDGMSGALQRKEIDIGGSPLFFWADRAKVMDYTSEMWDCRPTFMFRHPKRLGAFYTIFTRPLADSVWYCTLCFLMAAGVLLYLLLKIHSSSRRRGNMDTSWSLVVLSVLGAACQQGIALDRRLVAFRIVIFTLFIFSLTLNQYYNAAVVSTLLMEPPKNIRTLEDLLKSPLKAGTEGSLYTLFYFKRTTDPIAREIYEKKIMHKNERNILSAADGMGIVKRGGYAFHVDRTKGYRIMRTTFKEREICEMQEVQLFPPQKTVAVVSKGQPHRELITYGLRKMYEAGLLKRLLLVWDEPKPKCVNTPDSSIFSVNVHEFAMPLVLLVVGILASIVILYCEIYLEEWKRRQHPIPFLH